MKLELDFWDRSSRSCNGRDQIEEVPSVMETPYDGKLYKLPGGGGIHSLLRPKSYTEKWHNHASHMVILPVRSCLTCWILWPSTLLLVVIMLLLMLHSSDGGDAVRLHRVPLHHHSHWQYVKRTHAIVSLPRYRVGQS